MFGYSGRGGVAGGWRVEGVFAVSTASIKQKKKNISSEFVRLFLTH